MILLQTYPHFVNSTASLCCTSHCCDPFLDLAHAHFVAHNLLGCQLLRTLCWTMISPQQKIQVLVTFPFIGGKSIISGGGWNQSMKPTTRLVSALPHLLLVILLYPCFFLVYFSRNHQKIYNAPNHITNHGCSMLNISRNKSLPIPIAPPKQNNTQTASCKNSMVNVTISIFCKLLHLFHLGVQFHWFAWYNQQIIPTKNHPSPAAPSSADNWATSKLFIISWRRLVKNHIPSS